MSLTREFLRDKAKECDVELPKELISAIISEHITARDAFAEAQVKEELAKLPVNKAESVKDSEEYKALEKSFKDFKADVAAKEAKAAKENAYRAMLKDANLSERGIEKAVKYADWDAIELDEGGKLKNAADHVKIVKEDWAEYVTTTTTTGVKTEHPPANSGGNTMSKKDIMAIKDYDERIAAIEANPQVFGKN